MRRLGARRHGRRAPGAGNRGGKIGMHGMMWKRIGSQVQWCCYKAGRKLRARAGAIERLFHAPALPQNPEGKVFLHLGCGEVNSPEFINVDARPAPHVHYVRDATDLSVFPDNYADLIYACHVLEHVRHRAVTATLWEWRRVLKPGGVLRLSVPDFDKLVDLYQACSRDLESILPPLMGGQQHEYNMHRCIFNREYLSAKLTAAGFREVREWAAASVAHHDFTDWANAEVVRAGRVFPISLNLEAVK